MILFGVNFNAYYLILFRKFKKAVAIEEVRYYFLVIAAATAFITWSLCNTAMGFAEALKHAAFQVASIITTTVLPRLTLITGRGAARQYWCFSCSSVPVPAVPEAVSRCPVSCCSSRR